MSSNALNRLIIAGYWLAVVLWMIVIFAFSAQPYSGAITEQYFGKYNIPVRKLAHMLEYAVLFWLTFRALSESTRTAPTGYWRWRILLSLVFCIAYALTDEWHQSFVPGRSALITDVFVDTIGACIPAAWLMIERLMFNTLGNTKTIS